MSARSSLALNSAHLPALHLLCKLGWSFVSTPDCMALRGSTRELILKPHLVQYLQSRRFEYKGAQYPLSPSAVDQIVRELTTLSLGDGLLAANERLYRTLSLGITVTEFMPDGNKHQPTIPIIDWASPAANCWEVTEQLAVLSSHGTHHRTPGIVCYVNGLPLVVIEAKRPESRYAGEPMVAEGIDQHLRNQQPDEIPNLYVYAQLLLSISQFDGCYGTTHTAAKFWARWREEEFGDAHFVQCKNQPLSRETSAALCADKLLQMQNDFEERGSQAQSANDQERLLVSLLTPERLLEFLHGFVLFDHKLGKIVARYQQFFAIRALLARIRCQGEEGGRRQGGVVWHTTGSGKSFTMVFLSKALLHDPSLAECRLIVVTDRVDLESQLARNFISGGAFGSVLASKKDGEKSKASSGRDLARRIGQGTERIVFTLVHKFNTASKLPECRNDSADLVVLVDEAHRSHGGETHERMKKALPRAAYIAFTGTPLLKEEKTASKFGPIIHAYPLQRAVEDETVAPLIYEERIPELSIDAAAVNRWFEGITAGLSERQKADLQKKYASKGALYGAANRIELIAWDIALHFSENIKKLGFGLKGLVATGSKRDAIRYKQALDETGLVSSAVIISPPDTREGAGEVDEASMSEVLQWWKKNAGKDPEGYEKRVLSGFSEDDDPDLLIVVDRLLTGFDEPRNTVLYIDKPLRGHNLIQAVARVNRLHEAKRYGVLVDYRGILKELDTAIRAYQDLASRTLDGFDADDLEGLYQQFSAEYKRLPDSHEALWRIFQGINNRQDLEQYRQVLMPKFVTDADGVRAETYDSRQKLREDFYETLTRFGLCLQTALSSRSFFVDGRFSEATVRAYKEDLSFFTRLRQIVRRDALESVDYSAYEEQIRRMVDKQVFGREIREPEGVYLVHKLGQSEDPKSWSEAKTRNETDLIRTRLRRTIEQDLAGDPYAQSVFSELLKQAIADAEAMFEHPLKQYALFRTFEDYVAQREVEGIPASLGDNFHARAYFGAFRLALGKSLSSDSSDATVQSYVDEALEMDVAVRDAVAENSLNSQSIEAAIRKALLPRLFKRLGLEKAKEVIEQVIRITRIGMSREKH